MLLIAVGVGWGMLQNRARAGGNQDPVGRIAVATVAPLGRVWVQAAQRGQDFSFGVANAQRLVEENRNLLLQVRSAQVYQETVDRLEQELEAARSLAQMPNYGRAMRIVAPVWGYFPIENRLTIGAGRRQQVKPGLAVVAPEGLVGIVQTVAEDTAQVQLITSPLPFKIGALVEGQVPAPGLLHGESADRLALDFTDMNLPVKTGDIVVTSGFSENIPRGIPIGRVLQVVSDPDFGRKTAQVFPNVRIGRLRAVAVLR